MSVTKKNEVFGKSPIVLAIIQIRYEKLETFDIKKVKEIGKEINDVYPQIKESVLQNFRIDQASETKFSLDNKEITGVHFISKDGNNKLIVSNDKFTLEMHGTYIGWESISEMFKKYWTLFNPNLNGLVINGVSMRYLNRIDIPIDTKDISKYFTTYIFSNTGNHTLSQFQIKYTSFINDNIVHVGHTLDLPIDNKLPYFLDIDVIRLQKVENNIEVIWNILEDLREQKNTTFNDILTEETKKIIR
jgi:uncharacterized protein (TIGR04255 family)